jgi:formylglycine-generating enzyme required for sulfatase activity
VGGWEEIEMLFRAVGAICGVYCILHLFWAASDDDYFGLEVTSRSWWAKALGRTNVGVLIVGAGFLGISVSEGLKSGMPAWWGAEVDGEFIPYREGFYSLGIILGILIFSFLIHRINTRMPWDLARDIDEWRKVSWTPFVSKNLERRGAVWRLCRMALDQLKKDKEQQSSWRNDLSLDKEIGREFRNGEALPLMVVIPAGEFLMGSPDNEKDRSGDEGPVREVRIPHPLAVGKYPVTVGEFRRFVEATGHDTGASAFVWTGSEWEDEPGRGWRSPGFAQDDNHPVTYVNWNDAVAYAAWITKVTGRPYRLLSEAEWEYACRAGTQTRYAFGDEIDADKANFDLNKIGTTPVGSFPGNAFGLYDMHGNVWEWCQDCRTDNYQGAPNYGFAWTIGDRFSRVLRGGCYGSTPQHLRSAKRYWNASTARSGSWGFRLARDLEG